MKTCGKNWGGNVEYSSVTYQRETIGLYGRGWLPVPISTTLYATVPTFGRMRAQRIQ